MHSHSRVPFLLALVLALFLATSADASWGVNYRGSADREAVIALKECNYFDGRGIELLPGASLAPNGRVQRRREAGPNDISAHFAHARAVDPEEQQYANLGTCPQTLKNALCAVAESTNNEACSQNTQARVGGTSYRAAIQAECAPKQNDPFGFPLHVTPLQPNGQETLDYTTWLTGPTKFPLPLNVARVINNGNALSLFTHWDEFHINLANKVKDHFQRNKLACVLNYWHWVVEGAWARWRANVGQPNGASTAHILQARQMWVAASIIYNKLSNGEHISLPRMERAKMHILTNHWEPPQQA